MAEGKSRVERLDALIARTNPSLAARQAETGHWHETTTTDAGEVPNPKGPGAPYRLMTLADGRRRVVLNCEDGDVLSGTGDTVEDALAALEAKIFKE